MSQTQPKKIMIVAGEASGDAHAARLVMRLRELAQVENLEIEFFGATGRRLREEGVETIVNSDNLSIVGLPEIAKALPLFWRIFQTLKRAAIERKPDAVILVDFPDFNLKLARALKKSGLKVIYYISPQLWAWRQYRARSVKKYVDLVLTILPFEKDWYAGRGISHVEYVGNPLAREVHAETTREEFCRKHDLDHKRPIVALLAGSRHKEVARILPQLLETAALMAKKNPEIQFVNALAATRTVEETKAAIDTNRRKGIEPPVNFLTVRDETWEALNAADAAAVTSGTATLETAIIGTPMAIVYKSSTLNYTLLRPLISVPHFGLINLIAGERLAKEFIQSEFTPDNLAEELFRLLDAESNQKMRERLKQVVETLGHGAARNAAKAIIKVVSSER